jgi:outer membrane receptor for ferrienterochelin and colicin
VDDDGYRTLTRNEFQYYTTIGDATLRTDFEFTPSPAQTIRFGAGVTRHVFIPDGMSLSLREEADGKMVRDTLLHRSAGTYMPGWEASAYLEDEISLGRVSLNPGLHFALFSASGKNYPSFQPRLSARWAVTDSWTLKAGYSRMAQYVHRLPFARVNLPTDIWVPVTDRIPPQESDQWSTGVYYTGIPGWSLSAEVYYKDLRNILEFRNNRLVFSGADQWEKTIATGIGRAYGAEWLVEKTAGNLTGWLSYTLSRSERRIPDGSINDGRWFPYVNDRRHKISVYGDYTLNDRIDFSATWQFASGDRMTLPTRHSFTMGEDGLQEQLYIPSRNNWTVPPTHRLDVSVNFRKKKARGERVWNVGVYNVYAARNPDFMIYNENRRWTRTLPDGTTQSSLDQEEIPEGRIYAIKRSVFSVLPSVSYTRTF